MTVLHETRPTVHVDQPSDRSVLVDAGSGRGLVAVPRRRRDALLARLLGRSLDNRLAAGRAPESSRLLAVRAVQITNPSARQRLARDWDELAARSRQPRSLFDPRVPVARSRIEAAADEIQLVADTLRADRPVSARGVAIAVTLLTTAASPVYRLGASGADLAAAVGRAVSAL
jgi:hypothetical protein